MVHGFPKSHNLKDEYIGWGTALKPAHEPIVMARKPFRGTVAANVLEYGTGAINIDGCRVIAEGRPLRVGDYKDTENNTSDGRMNGSLMGGSKAVGTTDLGRWPANIIHDGSDEVLAGFPHTSSAAMKRFVEGYDGEGVTTFLRGRSGPHNQRADSGSAARFFYCAKASKKDRGEGNDHPTVKPTELMRYLVKLITPPNGFVLDPFMGSGSTGKAAILEHFNFIGIELDQEYYNIANDRISN